MDNLSLEMSDPRLAGATIVHYRSLYGKKLPGFPAFGLVNDGEHLYLDWQSCQSRHECNRNKASANDYAIGWPVDKYCQLHRLPYLNFRYPRIIPGSNGWKIHILGHHLNPGMCLVRAFAPEGFEYIVTLKSNGRAIFIDYGSCRVWCACSL